MTNNDLNPLSFDIKSSGINNEFQLARSAILTLPHGKVSTPAFMPVGTYGAIKGLTSHKMAQIGYKLILGNTYHLANTPGEEEISSRGKLHGFSNWENNLLTDSGGFQMVSLLKLAEITEKGVEFQNPKDGTLMLLTPEDSIRIQNSIGADIIMALDDVVKTVSPDEQRMKEATERTVRWLDRCIQSHTNKEQQSLFGIVQGGLNEELRAYCLTELIKRDLPGYAIGGLAGGESKDKFWKVVLQCTRALPKDKPKYLMGVGYPLDLVVCSALGCDLFDSVFPTRIARFGTAFSPKGFLNLTRSRFAKDLNPIDENCKCQTCSRFSRAYLHSIAGKQIQACTLVSEHNLTYLHNLMRDLRRSIEEGKLFDFVSSFLQEMFGEEEKVPKWARDALEEIGCDLKFTNK